jgi:Tfp pilus assembly PilM family ATPase
MNIRRLLPMQVLTVVVYRREVRWTLGRSAVGSSGRVPLPAGAVEDGVIVDPAFVGRILAETQDFPRHRRMRVLIALPAQRSVLRRLTLPHLGQRRFGEFVGREIRREMPMLAENAYVSWRSIKSSSEEANVFVAGVARNVLDSHVAMCRAAGLTVDAVDLRLIAAARAVGRVDCVIANVEDDEIEIGVFRAGVPAVVGSVDTPSPRPDPIWSRQLTEELMRTLKFDRDTNRDDSFDDAPICIVGDAETAAAAAREIADATGRRVELPHLRLTSRSDQESAPFAANIGLILRKRAA